jgi:hypothetical protein
LPVGVLVWGYAGWEVLDLNGLSDVIDDAVVAAYAQPDQTITIEIC